MKFCYLVFVASLGICFITACSLQTSDSLSVLSKTERIEGLAKTWGILKYHHPKIVTGQFQKDWDTELLQWLPRFEVAKSRDQYDALLQELIDSLGEMEWNCESKKFADSLILVNDVRKIIENNTLFNEEIQNQLTKIYGYCRFYRMPMYDDFTPHYFSKTPNNSQFYPSKEVRLQSLIFFWNHLQYFFPHHAITDAEWDDVLKEFIPLFEAAEDSIEFSLTILKLAKKMDDTHAFVFESPVLDSYFGDFFPPFKLDFVEGKTIVGSYHLDRRFLRSLKFRTYFNVDFWGKLSGINIGDEILAVEGVPIQTIRDSLKQFVGASNLPTLERNINSFILNGRTDSVEVTISSDGKNTRTTHIKRYTSKELQSLQIPFPSKSWQRLTTEIGYIDMARVITNQRDSIFNELKTTKAIIFDCRHYPTIAAFDLLPYFTQDDTTAFALFTYPYSPKAGYFSSKYHRNKSPKENTTSDAGDIVILVNEGTQSAGEYLCMQLQAATDKKAMVIGSQTAGADGMVSTIYFPGLFKLYYTGHGVFYPDGTPTQRVGIVPDIEVLPTIEGIRVGKDEVLEAAKEWVEENL